MFFVYFCHVINGFLFVFELLHKDMQKTDTGKL